MFADDPVALLLIVFNRPDKTRAIVEQLLDLEPCDILVAADGPRSEAERARTQEVRAIVGRLAGRHRVLTKFAGRNLGCGANVSLAIQWALRLFEQIIIVEDDICISQHFLTYCRQGLSTYRSREDILCLSSGPLINVEPARFPPTFLTRYPNIWGWATWRRAFTGYSLTLQDRTLRHIWRVLVRTFPGRLAPKLYFFMLILLVRSGRIDTWDFQFYFLGWEKGALALTPASPLAQNIGFDGEATHTRRAPANVARMTSSAGDPTALATASAAPNDAYDRMIERELWHVSLYRAARFLIKYMITRPKHYSINVE